MPRKPVTLQGGIGPRQRIWDAIRARDGQTWTAVDIQKATRPAGQIGGCVHEGTLQTYLMSLEAARIIRVAHFEPLRGVGRRKHYTLDRNEGVEAPRVRRDGTRVVQGLAQEQMWRTLRMLGADVNARELAAHASSNTAPVSEIAAGDYLRTLDRAGYLVCTQQGKGTGRGGIPGRYRLRPDRNTGPKPPMVCRTKVVFDPNLQEVVWAPEAVTEEDADHGR